MASSLETLRVELNRYPNSFRLRRQEELVYPKLDAMLQKLGKEEEDCTNGSIPLRTHYVCCVKNLKAFVLFKFNKTAEAFRLIDEVLALSKGRNVVCLANRGLMTLNSGDPTDAEDVLATIEKSTQWDLLLADAEMAYSYRKMGPRYNAFCREAYDNVIAKIADEKLGQCDPDSFQGDCPNLDEFRIFWCYGAVVAIDRALDRNVQTNLECFDVNKNGDPEKLLRRGCELLRLCMEKEESRTNGWIKYVEIYKKYKQIEPKKHRTLKLQWLTPGNLSVLDCLENADAAVDVETPREDHDALMRLGRLFLSGPKANLQKAKRYLYQSLATRETEFAHHQLSRVYTMELDNSYRNFKPQRGFQILITNPCSGRSENVPFVRSTSVQHIYDYYRRSPHDFRLQQAIFHTKRASELAGDSSAMMLTDLARCTFRSCADPGDTDTQMEIFGWLRQALTLKSSTKGDRAKVYMHMGMIRELFGERERAKLYLKKSIEEAASGGLENYPSLPIILEILREEISNSTDSEELLLYKTIEKIGKGKQKGPRGQQERKGTSVSKSILDYLEGKMRWFKGRGMVQEALISLKLLMSMRDLSYQEREFAIELCLDAERVHTAMDAKELTDNNFEELFAVLVKPVARENVANLCLETERIVTHLVQNGADSETIHDNVMSQLLTLPGSDPDVVQDIALEAEQMAIKMVDNTDLHHRLFCHLLKTSVSSHHDILIYSCDDNEDKEISRKLVDFLETRLCLSEHCCWAQRDLVHNCGGEYEVYMTKALCRSTRVVVHVTPKLIQDNMDTRILTSVLDDTHERASGHFIMVETTGDAAFVFPKWCRGRDASLVSLPEVIEKEQTIVAKRKLMKCLLVGNAE